MGSWWERPWVRYHATIAPFGVFATTLLLTLYLERWQWQGRASWELAGEMAEVAAMLYAMAAVLVEKGVNLMFWAWEKHKERMAKRRAEAQAELLATMQAEARAEEKPEIAAWLERVAQDQGITQDEPRTR